jgi:hypothetical protein
MVSKKVYKKLFEGFMIRHGCGWVVVQDVRPRRDMHGVCMYATVLRKRRVVSTLGGVATDVFV